MGYWLLVIEAVYSGLVSGYGRIVVLNDVETCRGASLQGIHIMIVCRYLIPSSAFTAAVRSSESLWKAQRVTSKT